MQGAPLPWRERLRQAVVPEAEPGHGVGLLRAARGLHLGAHHCSWKGQEEASSHAGDEDRCDDENYEMPCEKRTLYKGNWGSCYQEG